MTFADYQNYCSAKLGITDSVTKAQAGTFAAARWQMIWNAAFWRQSRMQTTVAVSANQQDVTLPSNFDFATAMRWSDGNFELYPTSDQAAFSRNPQGYDQQGTVTAFAPMGKDSNGNAIIRLFQVPQTAQNLLVIGKAKCTPLVNPTDTPLIPGVDECLVAFTMGDLYQWLRQFSKAQSFFQEASALLNQMKEIEKQQTSEVTQIIPMEQVMDWEVIPDWLKP